MHAGQNRHCKELYWTKLLFPTNFPKIVLQRQTSLSQQVGEPKKMDCVMPKCALFKECEFQCFDLAVVFLISETETASHSFLGRSCRENRLLN